MAKIQSNLGFIIINFEGIKGHEKPTTPGGANPDNMQCTSRRTGRRWPRFIRGTRRTAT